MEQNEKQTIKDLFDILCERDVDITPNKNIVNLLKMFGIDAEVIKIKIKNTDDTSQKDTQTSKTAEHIIMLYDAGIHEKTIAEIINVPIQTVSNVIQKHETKNNENAREIHWIVPISLKINVTADSEQEALDIVREQLKSNGFLKLNRIAGLPTVDDIYGETASFCAEHGFDAFDTVLTDSIIML